MAAKNHNFQLAFERLLKPEMGPCRTVEMLDVGDEVSELLEGIWDRIRDAGWVDILWSDGPVILIQIDEDYFFSYENGWKGKVR